MAREGQGYPRWRRDMMMMMIKSSSSSQGSKILETTMRFCLVHLNFAITAVFKGYWKIGILDLLACGILQTVKVACTKTLQLFFGYL